MCGSRGFRQGAGLRPRSLAMQGSTVLCHISFYGWLWGATGETPVLISPELVRWCLRSQFSVYRFVAAQARTRTSAHRSSGTIASKPRSVLHWRDASGTRRRRNAFSKLPNIKKRPKTAWCTTVSNPSRNFNRNFWPPRWRGQADRLAPAATPGASAHVPVW